MSQITKGIKSYYNEIDPFASAWLRELIKAGHITPGDVDERPIQDVSGDDLRGYDRCHFFAGIGGWDIALNMAGWGTRLVWSGSCPCQPFSSAGKQVGGRDDRHLWPYWARLIRECRPLTVFGEQVESAIAHGWLDAVFDDLEREGYACGAASLPAASVGAFHKRDRLWFVADSSGQGYGGTDRSRSEGLRDAVERRSGVGELADASHGDRWSRECGAETGVRQDRELARRGDVGDMGHTNGSGCETRDRQPVRTEARSQQSAKSGWDDVEWIACRDGKARPVEPTIFPLAYGISNRVGILRGAGNAIVPQVAAEVVKAFMEVSA